MPSIYQLKPRFQNLLRPLVQRLFARGVTANQVTLAAAAVSVLLGALVAAFAGYLWLFALIPLWMFLRMALNAIDGMLAREFGQQSVLGAYLNELCDVIADSALILPFAMLPEVSPLWVVVATLLAVIVEYAGVMGPLVGAGRRYDGPLGKSDRAFVFGVLGAGVATGLLPIDWLDTLFMLIAALLVWTLANRVRQGIAEADRSTPPA
ncbi:Inner membrane protein YnbA [compost metagenome]